MPITTASRSTSTLSTVVRVASAKRWIGHTLRAEVAATVDPALSVTEADSIAHLGEIHLLVQMRLLTAATIHASITGNHP